MAYCSFLVSKLSVVLSTGLTFKLSNTICWLALACLKQRLLPGLHTVCLKLIAK